MDVSHRYDCGGIQDPTARALAGICHRAGSKTSSSSARMVRKSTGGSRCHRSSRVSASTGCRLRGRSSATGLPSRVIVICSPRATRSTTSPPWLRSSRIVTSVMLSSVSRVIQAERRGQQRQGHDRHSGLAALFTSRERFLHPFITSGTTGWYHTLRTCASAAPEPRHYRSDEGRRLCREIVGSLAGLTRIMTALPTPTTGTTASARSNTTIILTPIDTRASPARAGTTNAPAPAAMVGTGPSRPAVGSAPAGPILARSAAAGQSVALVAGRYVSRDGRWSAGTRSCQCPARSSSG